MEDPLVIVERALAVAVDDLRAYLAGEAPRDKDGIRSVCERISTCRARLLKAKGKEDS
jgi:hypothetical protein